MQIGVLSDISTQLDFPGRHVNIEADWILFQLRKTDEHDYDPSGKRGRTSCKTALHLGRTMRAQTSNNSIRAEDLVTCAPANSEADLQNMYNNFSRKLSGRLL